MRALGVIGRILIGAGVVILLFAAYQVWGTSLQEAHTQTALRHTFVSDAKSNQLEQALNQATAQDALPTGPPAVAPTTGSAMKAATVSGPRRWNSASSSAASRATKSLSDSLSRFS